MYSSSCNIYYIGYSNDFERRLRMHNTSEDDTFTSKHRPWELKAVYLCGEDKTYAIKVERFIKRQKSRKLIEQLIAGYNFTGILGQQIRVSSVRD